MKAKPIVIEKGIPLPLKTPRLRKIKTTINSLYWIMTQMEIGDSFAVKKNPSISTIVTQFNHLENKLLITRSVELNQTRVWRLL